MPGLPDASRNTAHTSDFQRAPDTPKGQPQGHVPEAPRSLKGRLRAPRAFQSPKGTVEPQRRLRAPRGTPVVSAASSGGIC
eukprot:366053-Chlamydomonas_euryale.AAC.2